MKSKKLLSLILAAVMIISTGAIFAACSNNTDTDKPGTAEESAAANNSDLEYIKSNGKLVIAITDYPPMNYKDDNGNWTGFDTEYAQAVCKKLGVEAEFKLIEWGSKYTEINTRAVDCAWNGMTITDEVKANLDVTDAYSKNAQVVIVSENIKSKYTKLEEMNDLKWTAEKGSAGEELVKDMKGYVPVDSQSKALMEVASGSSDACVIDLTMANAMTGEGTSYENLTQVEKLNEEEFGIGFRKGSDLVDEVNKITQELIADGTMDKLAEKYNVTIVK